MTLKLYRHLIKKRRYRYPSIERRAHFGQWEGDLILFRHTHINVFTLRERNSRFIFAIKNVSRKAEDTTQALLGYVKQRLSKTMKTLTLDNGVEFSYHEKMTEKLKTKIYFFEPYKSYQKGAIKNANKRLREELTRTLEIDRHYQKALDAVAKKLNDRPMECLGFRTLAEVFFRSLTIYRSKDQVALNV